MKRLFAIVLVVLLAGCARPAPTPDPVEPFCHAVAAVQATVVAGTLAENHWTAEHYDTAPLAESYAQYRLQVDVSQEALVALYALDTCPACRPARDAYLAYLQAREAADNQRALYCVTLQASDYERARALVEESQRRQLQAKDAFDDLCP